MRSIAIASLLVLAGTTAQAEIICTNGGCFETGLKILRNGGAYSGLGYVNNRSALLRYETACQALAEAHTVDEVKALKRLLLVHRQEMIPEQQA